MYDRPFRLAEILGGHSFRSPSQFYLSGKLYKWIELFHHHGNHLTTTTYCQSEYVVFLDSTECSRVQSSSVAIPCDTFDSRHIDPTLTSHFFRGLLNMDRRSKGGKISGPSASISTFKGNGAQGALRDQWIREGERQVLNLGTILIRARRENLIDKRGAGGSGGAVIDQQSEEKKWVRLEAQQQE